MAITQERRVYLKKYHVRRKEADPNYYFRRTLSVDHDHETGEVRGLLCRRCNAGIGHFQERLDLLREAVRYLEVR